MLRGAALLGVFVENAQHFFRPTYSELAARPGASFADHAALWLIQVFCEHKVYALFALLFGYGIALQMARTGPGFVALQLWRMGILFWIGIFHLTLLWSGDILATYAVLGVLLLLFRARSTRALAWAAGLVLATPALALAALAAAGEGAPEILAEIRYPARQSLFAFAMFLLGLAAGRARGAEGDPLRVLRRQLPLLSAVGLAGSLAFVAVGGLTGAAVGSWAAAVSEALIALAAPALALAYAGWLLALLDRPSWQRALAPLAAAGRLSLTNYLMQSLIGVCVLARLGEIHPPAGIAIACAVYALQVVASRGWLAYFRFGPVEWLWRALSYGRLPPLRV